MHLLTARPGGFVDEEGIIDLAQTPADIVILAAADSVLAALASAVESLPESFPSCRLANWMQLIKPAAFDLYQHKVLDHAQVVVVSLLGGAGYWPYGFEQLQAWQQAKPHERQLILVPGDDAPDEDLWKANSVTEEASQRVWHYLRESGIGNARELLHYLANEYLDQPCTWQEPQALPRCMMYMPGASYTHAQATLQEWQARWRQYLITSLSQLSHQAESNKAQSDQAQIYQTQQHQTDYVCAVLFYRSHLQSGNTAMFDAFIEQLEQQGLQPLPIAIASLKDPESITLVNALISQTGAKLIINTTGFASNTVSSPDLSSQPTDFKSPFALDIPVFQVILSSSTEEDWQDYTQGLRSRDIAMQVVLPEMDGRIITRALSFKSESHYSERAQLSVVRYSLQPDRAKFVAKLAKRYCNLSNKPNSEKRIAVMLANYPTKDGRIGNGVGLDTPASTITLLTAMQQAGYPINNIPENGNVLIEELLGAVTNNPNTLHHLPCWQSLAVSDYLHYFAHMPEANQRAVWDRWGAPELDPKCRQGRLMLAGIRLGETFIGIQPARGFNVDLQANYHDPDLVPPHSYLAYYFWLRHTYQVDAIIHVGKHGNVEWLPGKGLALSDQCWPDIAMGAMPHFYPFIVNDPGEGAQAKRRTQAVIIDHLMPPMTRAETYGELAELEGLVDEYYQALGMDTRRETWLREQILAQVKDTHVLDELALSNTDNVIDKTIDKSRDKAVVDDDEMLEQLDAYLCDIKEAQIRHGLHRLGQLPDTDKLTDTLVALLRLPRGNDAQSQGILHNLVADLQLYQQEAELFDPLTASHEVWQGDKPAILAKTSLSFWRSEADTRERLELLAHDWVKRYVLLADDALSYAAKRNNSNTDDKYDLAQTKGSQAEEVLQTELDTLAKHFPQTVEQLRYARSTLLAALEKSVEQEIQALIQGLAGQFIEPGPSGAPTRGRLDTLPTGRNFFSVDNRSIPSPAAWVLGQRSAQAMIGRHLQEQGDYPKQLGLSVWGTATMRTGGDDIAQAFALMGIKPVWAKGSHRVIDFEIEPTMQLGRPRVDVTLRVSGFFRDAFPNVMKLYDAAVQAIAELDEPGDGNTIRQHIQARQAELEQEGMSTDDAKRQASYRVFGSKPGAYGAGLQGLIDERCWQQQSDLAEAYLNWGGYAYGNQQGNGVDAHAAFKHRLSQLEVVVQNQDNREHDLLDSDDYYQFQGGMTNAVNTYKGDAPVVYHNDHSNPSLPKVRTLKEELNRVIRSRVLNPKWIEAMQAHGYKGAFEMAASIDYLFAYDATTNLIDDYQYENVADALVFDQQNQDFLQQNNPNALEEMTERLLEAVQRGLWQEPGDYAEALQDLLLAIDSGQETA